LFKLIHLHSSTCSRHRAALAARTALSMIIKQVAARGMLPAQRGRTR
jgi:hypothetical protein